MNVSPIDHPTKTPATAAQRSPDQLRRAAVQFEALLLRQLTAAMSSSGTDDEQGEDQLFGSDSGTNLAKQMFSEQLATTMAQSGGVGLADMIMKKMGGNTAKSAGPLAAVRTGLDEIRSTPGAKAARNATLMQPARVSATGNGDEAEVISTFDDEARADGIDEALSHMILDGRIVNTTRPRLAPNAPVTLVGDTTPADPAAAAAPVASSGYRLPVEGRLSSGFGNRFHPIDKRIKFHAGVDLAVPIGTPVAAAADGVVKFAGESSGYGNLVVISHPDGRETRYGHLSRLEVSAGQAVSAGDEIALSGSTGKSTGPHVHFEIRENGHGVDPLKVLSKGLAHAAER